MVFEFVLFAILGYCVFTIQPQPPGTSRLILMIVFIVLMVIWMALGIYPLASAGDWPHLLHR